MRIIEWLLGLFRRPVHAKPVEHVSKRGLAIIKDFEGCRLTAYQDVVGVWTIGYGETKDVYPGMTITQDQAEAMLRTRIAQDFEPGVLVALSRQPTQQQFDAMVSLAYNIGTGAFGKSTLVRKFNAGDMQGAADQFLVWNRAGGKVVSGLVRRREAERALFMEAA